MKRLTIALGALALLGLVASTVSAEELKFGYVDVEQVFKKTAEGRAAVDKWKKYREEKETEAQDRLLPMKQKLEQKVAEFQKQMETMKPEAREKRQEALQKKYQDLMKAAKEYESGAQKKYEEIMGPIQKKLEEVVYDMGIKGRYTMIFRKADGLVLYSTSKIDITEEVIREFNARK